MYAQMDDGQTFQNINGSNLKWENKNAQWIRSTKCEVHCDNHIRSYLMKTQCTWEMYVERSLESAKKTNEHPIEYIMHNLFFMSE